MKYENIIELLEGIKANDLGGREDYEAMEVLNDAIERLEILQSN